jgi:carboxypeptidase family protein/carbohydrate-selective porin (OprB family)
MVLMAAVASAQNVSVTGRVANAQGGVIPNAVATLRQVPPPGTPIMPNMPGMGERTANTGADGAFTFDQVAPGPYVLLVDAPGFERSSQELTVAAGSSPNVSISLEALEIPGAEAAAPAGTATDTQALLDRIKTLESRVLELESTTVLSEPETRVRRIEVYVDQAGGQHDEPVAGARREVTYQRERVYRRQTISEKIEDALKEAEEQRVGVGVSAAIVPQFARQTKGRALDASGHAYQLASADLFFTAGIAQNTLFYADIVGLSGTPPDLEVPALTLLNGYSARLERQNVINLREAWLRTEVFSQKLALVGGRLDLTNFFDRNAAANDETTQFLSDALVNNPTLGLATNGSGFAAVFDPKNGLTFKGGFQQSNPDATSLSDSIFSLTEVGYAATIPSLGEGNYRAWYRSTNTSGATDTAWGLSLDQKVAAPLTLFGRYGDGEVPVGGADAPAVVDQTFWSAGFQLSKGAVFNPLDSWGIGYAQTKVNTGEQFTVGDTERLVEGYYSFQLSEKLRLSFHLTHSLQSPNRADDIGFLVPGIRFQAAF